MEAAQLVAPQTVAVGEAPEPTISRRGEVLVRSLYSTICGSDLHLIFGGTSLEPYPARPGYPGHESLGVVTDSSTPALEVGQHVLAVPDMIHASCYAELQVLPDAFVIPVDIETVGTDVVLAQQLGTVIWALKRFWPDGLSGEGRTALVLGAGPAGLFFVQLLRARGFEQIIVSDLHSERLDWARSFGATATLLAPGQDVVNGVLDLTDGIGADLVIEAAGEDVTRTSAVHAVASDGRIGLFGIPATLDDVAFPLDAFFRKKPTLMAQHGAQHEPGHASFREAIDLITAGHVDTRGVVTHWFSIDEFADALRLALHPRDGSLKIGIKFQL